MRFSLALFPLLSLPLLSPSPSLRINDSRKNTEIRQLLPELSDPEVGSPNEVAALGINKKSTWTAGMRRASKKEIRAEFATSKRKSS